MCAEQAGLEVGGIMGTSAGALAGSLYCAGFDAEQVQSDLYTLQPRGPTQAVVVSRMWSWTSAVMLAFEQLGNITQESLQASSYSQFTQA